MKMLKEGCLMRKIERISVIGAGTMGRGIAHVAAIGGFIVNLYDIDEKQLKSSIEEIKKNMSAAIELKKLSVEQMNKALENIEISTNLEESVKDADFVIEAILEEIDLKAEIFKKIEKVCKTNTIFASNTSTISPTEIASSTQRPDKFLAMHFFNPVHKMKLIEIIRGLDTSDETYQTARYVAEKMGKETVEVNDLPGFVTSRVNAIIGNEAMNLLLEGVASAEDIDKAIKLGLNHPMGPLELADLVGLDSRLRSVQHLHETLGERFRPSPILVKYVKAGRLGRKSGKGFYNYTK